MRESVAREQASRATLKGAMLDAMTSAIADSEHNPYGPLLAGLSPQEQSRIAEASDEPPGLISASDQSHMYNRFFFATPFSNLPETQQNSVLAILGQAGSGAGSEPPPDLRQSRVGLISAGGSIRLGVIPPGGSDLWVSPVAGPQRKSIPGIDRDDDAQPEVAEAVLSRNLVRLNGLPSSFRKKRLSFKDVKDRALLPTLLSAIVTQSGVSFACDDFLRSRKTPFFWLLSDKQEYTLEEALQQIARAFGHEFVYQDGIIVSRTVTPGLDLRAEPPGDLIMELQRREPKGRAFTLDESVRLADLSKLQLNTLLVSNIPELTMYAASAVVRCQGVLRFYRHLTEDQAQLALSADGLARSKMTMEQRRLFDSLCEAGLPPADANLASSHPAFLVSALPRGPSSTLITFTLVGAISARRFALAVTATKPNSP